MNTTVDRLRAILVRDYKLDAARVAADTPLESLGIDSLGVAELLFEVEDEFKVRMPPDPVQLATVGEVAAYIDRLVAAQQDARATPAAVAAGP